MDIQELTKRIERVEKRATDRYLNTKEAADFLRIGVSALNKITSPKNMLIPVASFGGKNKIFDRNDLIAFVESRKQEPIRQ